MAAKKVTVMVGFVPIATKIDVAVEEESSGTHTVCMGDGTVEHPPARVKQHVACPVCERTHTSVWGFDHRGVERDGGLVVLTDEELRTAAGEPQTGRAGKPAVQLAFHPREKVYGATLASDSVQNMYPDKGGEKAYALLRDALLANPEVVACMVWAPSTKNALWVLEVVGQRIVISKRCWPEQVRATMEVPEVEVADMERDMMTMLVRETAEDFDLGRYVDQSKLSLEELINSRSVVEGGEAPLRAAPASAVPDLLAAMQATLDAAGAKMKPVKKVAAKKTVAKKAAAPRKRAAKKTVAPLGKAS